MRTVFIVILALVFSISSGTAEALTTLTVTLSTDNNPGGMGEAGDFRYVLNSMNQGLNTTPDDYAIVFDVPMTIQLNGILPVINNSSNPVNVTIGNPGPIPTVTLDGNSGAYSGLFIPIGNVTIQNMIFQNLTAKGGKGGDGISGGGGGMGAGGAIYAPQVFLNGSYPSITLINVSINNSAAIGGNGGSYLGGSSTGNEGGGGGGGFSGNGGSIATTGSTGGGGGGGFGGDGGDVTVSTDEQNGGGGGGGGGFGSRATLGTLSNLGNGGSDQGIGLDGNGYGLLITAGSGGGGMSGGNMAGGGGGGGPTTTLVGGGGGGSAGADGLVPQGTTAPWSEYMPSGGNGGDGGGGGGGAVVTLSASNDVDGQAANGGYGGGGGGGAGTGASDEDYTVLGGQGGLGGGGGGGGVNQSGETSAEGGDSLGGGGGGGGGPSNGLSAAGGSDTGNLGGGSGGIGVNTAGQGFGGGGGGGGSGLGGAIFVDRNLNLTVQAIPGTPTTFNTTNNVTQAGTHGNGGGGGSDGTDGSAFGNSIFLRSGSSLTFLAQNADDLLTLGEGVKFTDDTVFAAGGSSVFVRGNGAVVYNGTTDYQGTISVSNANFKVNGEIDAATILVCRNISFSPQRGTLSGSGTLTGNVFVNSGTVAPDRGETLTLGGLSLNPADPSNNTLGSLVQIAIDFSGTSLVSVTGPASLAGTLEIALDPTAIPGTYRILTSSAVAGAFDSVTFTGATPIYEIHYQPTFVEFVFTGFATTPTPVPQFSPSSVDFGARPIQSTHQISVVLSNAGNSDFTVNGFSISGAFTATDNCPAVLAPNASCTVQITFSPAAVGSYSGVLRLNSDAPGTPAAVTLKGVGVGGYQVTATVADGGGTISPAAATVVGGQTQTFIVTPAAGYRISSVSGCGGSLTGSTFTTAPISESCPVTAAFAAVRFQVTAAVPSGGGNILPAAVMVAEGQAQTFTVTPDVGYTFSSVSGCGGSLSGGTFTTAPITEACSITGIFAVVVTAHGKSGGGSMTLFTLGGLLITLLSRCFRRRFCGVVALLLALPLMAQAGDFSPWYAGFRVGNARTDVSSADVNNRLSDLGYDVSARVEDSSRTAWGVFGGWRVSQNFGVQLGYTHLGTVDTVFTGDALDIQAFLRDASRLQPHSASGFDLSLVGRYPLGRRFEITAQLGAFAWNADYTVSNSGGDFLKREDNGLNLTYGAGLEYGLDGGLAFTGGWTRYKVNSESIDFLGVGLQYRWH